MPKSPEENKFPEHLLDMEPIDGPNVDVLKPPYSRPKRDTITETRNLVRRLMDEGWGENTAPVDD